MHAKVRAALCDHLDAQTDSYLSADGFRIVLSPIDVAEYLQKYNLEIEK